MLSWRREVIPFAERRLAPSTTTVVASDPQYWEETTHAREASVFVDVDYLDPGCALELHLLGGGSPDVMTMIASSPIPGLGATRVLFPSPLPAFSRVDVHMVHATTPLVAKITSFRVLTCYLQ